MSVYNFNDREHETSNDNSRSTSGFRSNGTTIQHAGYHQIESEFLNRSLATNSSSQIDNSVQLTRPTSKTALLVRQRRAMLEQLSCFICKGYLIDATTLDECMDSFCKSCIVLHLRACNNCPKCNVVIRHSNPLFAMKSDKVLQDIVYKLIPGLYDDEMKRRRDFYREFYGATQESSDDDEDSDSSSGTLTIQGTSLSGERYGVIMHPKPFYKPTDSIDLSIEPQTRGDSTTIYYDNKRQSIVTCFTGSLQQRDLNNDSGAVFSSVEGQLFKTYLRCPAKFTVLQLKKFIAAKFNIFRDDTIHLLYLNESLREEYSLIDVAYIYDWRGTEHMQLFYIIERDLIKVNTSDQQQDNHTRAGKVTRQSVGISTQTMKRVCIDPRPKFYEEKNNNNIGESRCMRLRNDESFTSNGTTKVSQAVQANPIIRNSGTQKTFYIQTNGTSTHHRTQDSLQSRSNQQRHVVGRASASNVNQLGRASVGTSETRSLRSQATAVKTTATTNARLNDTNSQPRVNVGGTSGQHQSQLRSNAIAQTRTGNIATTVSRDGSTKQLVPYTGNGFRSNSSNAATQSSIVTLASFTEARTDNLITAVSSTSASVQTLINDHHVTGTNNISTNATLAQPNNSSYTMKSNSLPRVQPTPQLAFSFVTERGITIVRRINNQDEATGSIPTVQASSAASSQNLVGLRSSDETAPMYSGSNRTSTTIANNQSGGQVQHAQTSTSNLNIISGQPVSQSSSSHRVNEDTVTSRHNFKAKPVYKLFPDPTKLKSPNLKKLGYTARH